VPSKCGPSRRSSSTKSRIERDAVAIA
jgi:hypothetical protein